MWWYLLWWLVICHGSTALGVAVVNRLHGCRLSSPAIHFSHKVHYLLLVAIPAATFVATGWYGPGLLRGGSWSDLSPTWWAVFAASAAATIVFWGSVLLRSLRRDPAHQRRHEMAVRDLVQETGSAPIGQGPYRWMATLPGNEVFRLQVTQRELVIPNLPAAWDGLSILHFSDAHLTGTLDQPYYAWVMQQAQTLSADLICFTGDLLDDQDLLPWLPATLGQLQAPLGRLFILGNHDWHLDMDAIRDELTRLGWRDVSTSPLTLERQGDQLYLAGSEYPWIDHQPSFERVPAAALRILLSHTPDNIARARRDRVDLMLSGHNHGGQIRLPVIGPVYCPSRFGCYYSEGLFWEGPTLLHVSRGLAGRHPLRYGCLPEITKLVLRCPDSL